MPPPQLLDLPPEVLIEIDKDLDTFQAITAFASTSLKTHKVWLSNPTAIWKCVRPRVPSLKAAEELLKLQKYRALAPWRSGRRQTIPNHEKALIVNAKKVSQIFQAHKTNENGRLCFGDNEESFSWYFYEILIVVALMDDKAAQYARLLGLEDFEVESLEELARWLMNKCPIKRKLGITVRNGVFSEGNSPYKGPTPSGADCSSDLIAADWGTAFDAIHGASWEAWRRFERYHSG